MKPLPKWEKNYKDRIRNWTGTWNNYTEEDLIALQNADWDAKWWCYGAEKAPSTGTPHIHINIMFINKHHLGYIEQHVDPKKKCWWVPTIHLEANINYNLEEGNGWASGPRPQIGRSQTLDNICYDINNGFITTWEEVTEISPGVASQHERVIRTRLNKMHKRRDEAVLRILEGEPSACMNGAIEFCAEHKWDYYELTSFQWMGNYDYEPVLIITAEVITKRDRTALLGLIGKGKCEMPLKGMLSIQVDSPIIIYIGKLLNLFPALEHHNNWGTNL